MSKVLFMNGPAHGHINPTLALVEELVKRGEKVTYFSTEEFRDRIEATGAEFRAYKNFMKIINPDSVHNNIFGLIEIMAKACNVIIPEVLAATKGEKYDYMIHDSMFGCGRQISQIFKVPAISSCTTFAMNKKLKVMPKLTAIKKFKMILQGIPHILNFTKINREMKKNYRIKGNCMFNTFYNRGELNIVYTSRYFQPCCEAFDDSYKFVGPSIMERKESLDFTWHKQIDKPLIFISLGTINNKHTDFYKLCFEAFKNKNIQVVLAVGMQTSISGLTRIPENFTVTRYVPQLEVLKQTDVFITHGGMNSTSEALFFGVPLVVIPMASDQFAVAAQVEKLGAGVSLCKEKLTAEELRNTTIKVLDERTYREKSDEISKSFKDAGGYKGACDEIFAFKKKLGIK